MSTSDAGESERRVVGGERATPQCGTARPARTERVNQDETVGEKQTSPHHHDTPTDQRRYRPGIRREETHRARTLRPDELIKNSDFQNRRTDELKFTSSLFLRLSTNLGFDRVALRHSSSVDACLQSVIEPQHSESNSSRFQADDGRSPRHSSVEKAGVHSLSGTRPSPAGAGRDVPSRPHTEQSVSHALSNGGCRPQKHPEPHSSVSRGGTDSGPSPAESQTHVREQQTLEHQAEQQGRTSVSMLSSTVVSVLAPHWSSRLRRAKRFEGAGGSDAQGNLQDPPGSHEGLAAGGSQPQIRGPFLGSRSHTVGWSTNSEPPGVDYDSRRKLLQTVSLDAEKTASGFHLDQSDQRRSPQALSSKPTTSSLLLSLRRINSRNNNEAATSPNAGPPSLSSSPGDPGGTPSHLSHSFLNNNERPKRLLSPSSPSYRTPEAGPALSPSSANQRERNKPDSLFFPTSPLKKSAESKTASHFTSSTQQSGRATEQSGNASLPGYASVDHAPLQKPPVPRATLTSTSWWKQVTQEGGASLARSDAASGQDKANTPFTPASHENRSPAERLGSQTLSNRLNSNTTEPLFKGGRALKPQGGAADLNARPPPKTFSMPDVSFAVKFSRAATPVTLSRLRDPGQQDGSAAYFATSAAESTPTLPSPRGSSTPTESSSGLWPPSSSSSPSPTAQHFPRASRSPDFAGQASPSPSALSPSSFPFHPLPSPTSVPAPAREGGASPKFPDRAGTTPLGFERKYASVPKPFQSKAASALIPPPFSKTNYNPTSLSFSSTTSTSPKPTSPSLLSPPATSPTAISSFLTPPATPGLPFGSSPKVGRTFTSSLEREPKKKRVEGKRQRRVTFDPSVDLQCSESPGGDKQDTPPAPSNPASSFFGGKFRSLSSDSADLASRDKSKQRNSDGSNPETPGSTAPWQERALSVESGAAPCRSAAPLSLPPDFSSYKLRYSSPPYSTLMSSRLAQGEAAKPITPRSPLFPQSSQSHYTFSRMPDKTLTSPKPPVSPTRTPQLLPTPFLKQGRESCAASESDQINNNHEPTAPQPLQSSAVLLVNNRVNFGAQSLQGDRTSGPSSSSHVTETLIYTIKPKADAATAAAAAAPKPSQHVANTPEPAAPGFAQRSAQSREAVAKSCRRSDQSSSGSSSTDSSTHGRAGRLKDSVLGKSRFLSVEGSSEQSPKKSRFALKKSVSTPSAALSRSDSDRSNRNKMDQVLHKLKKTFSTRRSDDDPSFSFKWRRSSQTPSVGSSSDVSVESAKTPGERAQDGDAQKKSEEAERWTQNRYTIVTPSTGGNTAAAASDRFTGWSEPITSQNEPNVSADDKPETSVQVQLRVHSPTPHQYDLYTETSTDYQAANQLLPCRDHSPGRSPAPSGPYPYRRSTPSPRSPFSPFGSLSPVSPFSPPDPTDDNVFYSPKLQRRKDTASPCDPGEGVGPAGARRSRASAGPPSAAPVPDAEQLASSYADLKYGMAPGRSFSVSSVLTSRPSGPGRISTGSRFMSVGDLTQPAPSCGAAASSVAADRVSGRVSKSPSDGNKWFFAGDPGKLRSRSLPRSLSRNLASWSAEASGPAAAAAKPSQLHGAAMNICHFPWGADGPPTPPPTPPLSPVSRRMSKPPSLSSPAAAAPSPRAESPASRHLPSAGYRSSLSTFDESSDSGSDTTTDGDYYLESDEDEKETEL